MPGRTRVEISGEDFLINGEPTYKGRVWQGHRIEGLLYNTRMVCAAFDDINPDTRGRWAYPDTGVWDPDRNTDEFVRHLPDYRRHGVLAVTLCLQFGAPGRYVKQQPWHSSTFTADGSLRPQFLPRFRRALDALDALGMVAFLGYFYFQQDEKILGEDAVRAAVDNATAWVLDQGCTNVIVDVANECDVDRYRHEIMGPNRVHELIDRVRSASRGGRRLLAGTSFTPRTAPTEAVVRASDLILLHGNGARTPWHLSMLIERARSVPGFRPMPVVINEDDNFGFGEPRNHLLEATCLHASWGYYDNGPGTLGSLTPSNYHDGFQNPPINWAINTEKKRGFFEKVREITGA